MTNPTHSTGNPATETGPQLRYSDAGRGGTIHYTSSESNFDMWYELAMPPAIVIIGIPEPQYWVGQTKTPLSQRETILQFIGEQVIKDRLSGPGYFDYTDNIMSIYTGKNPDKD